MPMNGLRSGLLLLSLTLVGCLDSSGAVLAYKDRAPPSVLSTTPDADASISRTTAISITFSEAMDTRTLSAGIQVSKAGIPVPLVLGIPSPDQLPQTADNVDEPYTVTARPVSGSLEQSPGGLLDYSLLLSPLLTDQAGNALPSPGVRIRFSVM
jgi:hypothetical protein